MKCQQSYLGKAFDFFAWISLIIILVLNVIAVFMRYVKGSPLQWSEEVNQLLFIWLIMLGGAAVHCEGKHLRIDVITSYFPAMLQKIVNILVELVVMATSLTLAWYGLRFSLNVTDKVTDILRIPYFYIDIAIPLGAVGIAYFALRKIVFLVRERAA